MLGVAILEQKKTRSQVEWGPLLSRFPRQAKKSLQYHANKILKKHTSSATKRTACEAGKESAIESKSARTTMVTALTDPAERHGFDGGRATTSTALKQGEEITTPRVDVFTLCEKQKREIMALKQQLCDEKAVVRSIRASAKEFKTQSTQATNIASIESGSIVELSFVQEQLNAAKIAAEASFLTEQELRKELFAEKKEV